jgi:hypothetical protein
MTTPKIGVRHELVVQPGVPYVVDFKNYPLFTVKISTATPSVKGKYTITFESKGADAPVTHELTWAENTEPQPLQYQCTYDNPPTIKVTGEGSVTLSAVVVLDPAQTDDEEEEEEEEEDNEAD